MERKNLGRQKVEMVKMTKESNLQVTFSKRRGGLFKKASELSTLCGVELALVVFSPGNKVFSFGHPSVDIIIDRYSRNSAPETSITSQIIGAHRDSNVRRLNMELTELTSQLEAKKKLGAELTQMSKANQELYWFQSPIQELDLSQLQQLKSALEKLKNDVESQKLALLNSIDPQQFYMGSTSSAQVMNIPNHMPNNNNNMGMFNPNLMNGGYNIVPTPGYNPNPAQGYGVNLAQGYTANPQVNPAAAGYNTNPVPVPVPVQGYGITTPAEGYAANPQGNDIILQNPGFGAGYNAIANPLENDILNNTSGFGAGYETNPQDSEILSLLGFGGGIF
ncbi:hypothetical protein GQ457_10G022070 [Hibiscus cannabinus]